MPTIVIDFDGPIHDFSEGYRGLDIFGKPTEGAQQHIARLHNDGWNIAIFGPRPMSPYLWYWLCRHGFNYHYYNGWSKSELDNHMKSAHGLTWVKDKWSSADDLHKIIKGSASLPPKPWPFNPASVTDGAKPLAQVYVDDRDWLSIGRPINWKFIYYTLVYHFYVKVQEVAKAQEAMLVIAGEQIGIVANTQFKNAKVELLDGTVVKQAVAPEVPEDFFKFGA